MFSGLLCMDSYWEPKPTPCARRWGEVPHARQVGQAPLGPKRARHAWCARWATCSTCAKCTACSSRARRAMCGARAACARCARARDSTHRDTCRPPPSVSKTNAQSRRVAIMVSGGPAHTRPYASTPAVHVKNNLTVIAGCPRMIQFRHFVLFFARESVRVAHTYDPTCCPEV